MILDKNKNKIKPYYSNYKPCNIYKGKEKIAGYKTTTVNSNSATFNNTYNDFIELSANGKAEQVQYEGYNLISTDIALWEEGHYHEGTGEPFKYIGRIRLKELFKVKPSTKYYFKVITDKMLNIQADFSFVIRAFDKDKKFISSWGGGIIDIVKDIPQNVEYLGIALYSANDDPKWTLRWYDTQFKNGNIKIMICESDIAKPYEPYCGGVPSPNLDYPQEIKTVDKIGVNISSLNLFDGVPIADVKPSRFQHCDYETIYDEELKRNVLHITCGKENQIWPVINYNLLKRLEKDKYYCFKFKYKYFLENPVNNISWDTLWFFMNESSNGWDNFALAHSKKAITTVAEKWTDRIIKFKADNPYFDKNEYSYSKILLSLGNGRYIQGGESVNVTWLKKEVFISDVMLYEITEEEYNDTNYTSLDYKQYFSSITKENILSTNEELASLPNEIKDEIRENKLIKKIGKIVLDGTETKWAIEDTPAYKRFTLPIENCVVATKRGAVLSNYFFNMGNANSNTHITGGAFTFYGKIFLYHNALNVEEFKKWLAERKSQGKSVIVYYELATPTEMAIDKIKSLPLTTKVDIKANLDTEIRIECKEME